jgi:hypothetical protein
MAKSLLEYADWLDSRGLRWPAPPKRQPLSATPYVKPLPGIKAVTWNLYGTLLSIADGELLFQAPLPIRMEVALDKTIKEFNMWNSMTRKPGAPWEYMLTLFNRVFDELRLGGSAKRGDVVEINSATLWKKLLGKLEQKEYQYDVDSLGTIDDLSVKVAYFFHSALQGMELEPGADLALTAVANAGLTQTLLADTQPFSWAQLQRAWKQAGASRAVGSLLQMPLAAESWDVGVKKPSKTLYEKLLARMASKEIAPAQVLHVSSRLKDDLAIAKSLGMKTVLYAGDKTSLRATKEELTDPALKPDRLLTELPQIRDILQLS